MTALVTGLAAVLLAGAPHPAHASEHRTPLTVSIHTLTPSTLPRDGTVTLTGEITNRSASTWTDLNAYLFASSTPMTTSAELEEATGTSPALEVGARVTAEGRYDEVADLAPGESTDFRISVPRRDLPITEAGVYWIGVHVLGSNEDGRVEGADGRARTFIAAMPSSPPSISMAMVLPLRERVIRAADGRLGAEDRWRRMLADDGRLDRLLDLTSTASDTPLTWLVDPAVLDATRSVAEGNPGFVISPTGRDDASRTAAEASPTPAPGGDEPDEVSPEEQQAADWLEEFVGQAEEQTVMSLPYGDVDVAALSRRGFADVYRRATKLGADTFGALALDTAPVVSPLGGRLPDKALDLLDDETSVLLDEGASDTAASVVRLPQGRRVALSSSTARIAGPGPEPRYGALALRQRILAEAAARALTGDAEQPLVVTVPERWDPGDEWRSAGFFSGLDVPWLRPVDLPFALAATDPEPHEGQLSYPRELRRQELPVANVTATHELDVAGSVLAGLLSRNDTVDGEIGRAAMLGSSVHVRPAPDRGLRMTRRITGQVRGQLNRVYVEGSSLVTMSSETGNFSVTVVNGLEEPVTVGLRVRTGSEALDIRTPDLVSLGPGQRASVRLAVRAQGTGVHSVQVIPTTEDGRPLGRSTRIKVRSSQVGLVIWLIIGTGAAVFVVAIALRVSRRMRSRTGKGRPR